MAYPEVVEGEVGRYERWDPDAHGRAFVELCADREVMRFLGGPMRRHVAREISARIADHWATYGFGLWAAIDLADGRVAGFTGACRAAWHPRHAQDVEVGWRLGRWSWGRGLATEGAARSIAPAFEHAGVDVLYAFVHPDNHRSRAVVERLGMTKTGRTSDPRLGHPLEIFTLDAPNVRHSRS